MSFEFEHPESTDTGSNQLEKVGWYHATVVDVDEQPTKNSGELIDGFRVTFVVIDGDNPDQKRREFKDLFFNPDLSKTAKSIEFKRSKQARFFLATDIMPKGPHKPGDRITINLEDAKGRQLIVKTEFGTDIKTGQDSEYAQIAFKEIYHVDDPARSNVKKSQAHLDLIPAEMRKKPEDFGDGKKNGGGNGKPGGGASGGGKSTDAAKAAAAEILNGGGGNGNGATSGGAAASTSIEDL